MSRTQRTCFSLSRNYFLSVLLSIAVVFCLACGDGSSSGGDVGGPYTILTPSMKDGSTIAESKVHACVTGLDGKIYCGGTSTNITGADDIFLVRLNADGSVDGSFGTSGYFIDSADHCRALAVHPDGSILIAGENQNRAFVMKVKTDGTIDTGFGTGGTYMWRTVTLPDEDTVQAITVYGGNIYLGINASNYIIPSISNKDIVVIRLSSNGILDTTFGTGGEWKYNGTANLDDEIRAILADASGIYLAGYIANSTVNAGKNVFTVIKLNAAATAYDTSFNTTGIVSLFTTTAYKSEAHDMAISGNTLYVAGKRKVAATDNDMAVTAFDKNTGGFVTAFNGGAPLTFDGGNAKDDSGKCMTINNGKIYIAGYIENKVTSRDRFAWIVTDAGVQESQFTVTADGTDDEINCILGLTNGSILMGGYVGVNPIIWIRQ